MFPAPIKISFRRKTSALDLCIFCPLSIICSPSIHESCLGVQDRWGRAWSRSPAAGFMLSAAFFATFPGPGIAMKSTTQKNGLVTVSTNKKSYYKQDFKELIFVFTGNRRKKNDFILQQERVLLNIQKNHLTVEVNSSRNKQ